MNLHSEFFLSTNLSFMPFFSVLLLLWSSPPSLESFVDPRDLMDIRQNKLIRSSPSLDWIHWTKEREPAAAADRHCRLCEQVHQKEKKT